MNVNLIQSKLISHLPVKVIRHLRQLRELRDYFRALLYLALGVPRKYSAYAKKYHDSGKHEKAPDKTSPQEEWGASFQYYRKSVGRLDAARLVWADMPVPGNFGDWLSPYIFQKYAQSRVLHISPVKQPRRPHFVGLGSIITCANPFSHVIGAGISQRKALIDTNARFHAVRGPYTAERVRELGGAQIDTYGDPGFLLPKIYQPKKSIAKKTEILLVRHINHQNLPLIGIEAVRERSISVAFPNRIEDFIDDLLGSNLVVTSAMHCMIACIAYGVPCILIEPKDDKIPVPGDGIKYRDTLAGVGLRETVPKKLDFGRNFMEQISDLEPYTEKLADENLESLERVYATLPEMLADMSTHGNNH